MLEARRKGHGMPGIHIATGDELPGPDGDEPHVLFVNQTSFGTPATARPACGYLRTNIQSAQVTCSSLWRATRWSIRRRSRSHCCHQGREDGW